MTDQTLELLLKRLDHLTVEFNELRDGVLKAVRISNDDPEMALTRARKVLEYVVRDVFALRCQEDPGTRPLENILQRLVKDGHLPKRLGAYASYIRDLGNVSTHVYGEELSKDDVRRSFENLTAILEWYFERVRPDAFMKAPDPTREEGKDPHFAEEEVRRGHEELERQRREAEELKRLEVAEVRAGVKEPAPTTASRESQSVNRLAQRPEGRDQLSAPPSSPPAGRKMFTLGISCVVGAVLWFLLGLGGLIPIILFLLGLLLLGIHIGRRSFRKPGVHPEDAALLPPPADKPSQFPGAPQSPPAIAGALRGTLVKITFGAICGLVAGALAAPMLGFYDPARIIMALLVGVLHGLAIGFLLLAISKVLAGKVRTSLVGIVIGIIAGMIIRAMLAMLMGGGYGQFGRYLHTQDGMAVELLFGGILGLILGAIHGSRRRV